VPFDPAELALGAQESRHAPPPHVAVPPAGHARRDPARHAQRRLDRVGRRQRPPQYPRHARPHNSEEDYAWSSQIFGKPLAGQRVTDILAIVDGLRSRPEFARRRVILAARGVLTVPAQFAAAIEPVLDVLYLCDGLISFRSIVETEVYKYPFGNFVMNLLGHTDLPELTASLAPRRVTLAGAIDGAGNRLAIDAVQAAFGTASNIRVLPESAWNPADILSA